MSVCACEYTRMLRKSVACMAFTDLHACVGHVSGHCRGHGYSVSPRRSTTPRSLGLSNWPRCSTFPCQRRHVYSTCLGQHVAQGWAAIFPANTTLTSVPCAHAHVRGCVRAHVHVCMRVCACVCGLHCRPHKPHFTHSTTACSLRHSPAPAAVTALLSASITASVTA